MDAFPTPEADSGNARAKDINERREESLRKDRFIGNLALVLVSCTIMFGAVLMAERYEKRMALINQEVAVKW